MADYPRIPSFKTAADFRAHLNELKLDIDLDEEILDASSSPLAQSCQCYGKTVGNRWAILPMEGWDCLPEAVWTAERERAAKLTELVAKLKEQLKGM